MRCLECNTIEFEYSETMGETSGGHVWLITGIVVISAVSKMLVGFPIDLIFCLLLLFTDAAFGTLIDESVGSGSSSRDNTGSRLYNFSVRCFFNS